MAESVQIASTRNWHEELIDFMIANPTIRQKQMARHFNVSYGWLSIVINSDAFKEKYAQRRDEKSFLLNASVNDKLLGIAHQSLDEISDRLDTQGTNIPIAALKDTAEMALKSLGFGAPKAPAAQQQVNVFVADKNSLAEARKAMAALSTERGKEIELQKEVESGREDTAKLLPPSA